MKLRWLAIGAVLLVALWLAGAFYEHHVIEVPESYRGPVVVFFGHPNGGTPDWEWGRRVFRVPHDGVLRIKSELTSRPRNEEWVFVSADGRRQPIPDLDGIKPEDLSSIKRPGVIQSVTVTRGDQHWIQASVITPSDEDTILENPHFVVERVREEVLRLKQQSATPRR